MSGSRAITKSTRGCGRELLGCGGAGAVNFTGEVKVLYDSKKEEGGHDGRLSDLRAWVKHPGKASSCFMMPP